MPSRIGVCGLALLGALVQGGGRGSMAAEPWAPAAGPLRTRWASAVDPARCLPDYPRPHLVRSRWLNLNGLWSYAITERTAARFPDRPDGSILVPFAVESALSGVMRPLRPDQRLWYRREWAVPDAWAGQRLLLHFGAVDWETTVWVNGQPVGSHRGGFDEFTLDITRALRRDGPQEVVVAVLDPTNEGWQLRGKQSLHPAGAFYTATSGIWQTVWVEPVPLSRICDLQVVTREAREGHVRLTVPCQTEPRPFQVRATIQRPGATEPGTTATAPLNTEITEAVARNLQWYKAQTTTGQVDLDLTIPQPRVWTPADPFLYELKVELLTADGAVVDSVGSYLGLRTISVGRDERGHPRPLLNGEPIALVGALDQGFWPDGIYTAPTDEALRFDIEAARRLGFNAIRKHVKVEPERYYAWADRLGLLILQDLPSGSEGDPRTDLATNPEAASQARAEREALIRGRGHHPSVIAWVLFNEGWGQHETRSLASWAKALDPSRLIDEASGFPWHGGGDIVDCHGGIPPRDPKRISLDTETAGFGLSVPGHQWPGTPWATGTYRADTDGEASGPLHPLDPASRAWYTNRVTQFYRDFWNSHQQTGSSGDFKVQLTDVETESNGLLSYDRAEWKVDPEAVALAARGPVALAPAPTPAPTSVPPNPIYFQGRTSRDEVRDPCIVREGDTYYLVFTVWPFRNREEKHLAEADQGGSPGIKLFSSRDLKDWQFERWLVRSADLPESCPYKNRFWAPEIHKLGGKFYLIFTADNWIKPEYNPAGTWGTAGYAFVGVADRIDGPYSHITSIPGAACDTSLFEDGAGRTFAVIPRGNIDIQEIDLTQLPRDRVTLLGKPRRIVTASNADIGVEAQPDYLEGPWVERFGERYVLLYAAIYKDERFPDFLGYKTGAAYADDPLGLWTKDPRGQVFFGGHLAAFPGPDGRRWFSYRVEADAKHRGFLAIDPWALDAAGRVVAGPPTIGPRP